MMETSHEQQDTVDAGHVSPRFEECVAGGVCVCLLLGYFLQVAGSVNFRGRTRSLRQMTYVSEGPEQFLHR